MTNPSKQKGTKFESWIVDHLNANGYPTAERRALHGNTDRGDITGTPGLAWELKATKQLDIAQFLREAETARTNSGADIGAVVWKRRQQPAGQSAVILTLDTYLALTRQAGYGTPPADRLAQARAVLKPGGN